MNSLWRDVYKNITSTTPSLDENYLIEILHLSNTEEINSAEIVEVTDSNTALIIKACIHIADGHNCHKRTLFIKTAKPDDKTDVYHDKSVREVLFYKMLLGHPTVQLPVPRCFDAYLSENNGEFFIVLEDLSELYRAVCDDDLTNETTWYLCAESLAKFHAAFWNDPQLGKDELSSTGGRDVNAEIRRNQEYLRTFISEFQGRFSEKTIRIFQHAMDINSKIMLDSNREASKRGNITICNGDSHIYNFMVPYDNTYEPVMVDFQFWGKGSGTGDLAHLTRVNFSNEMKRAIQLPLVKRYHETLQKCGVRGYSWEECIRNYRNEVAAMVLIPMWQYCCFGLKYEEWIGDVDGLVFNYECMGCGEILV